MKNKMYKIKKEVVITLVSSKTSNWVARGQKMAERILQILPLSSLGILIYFRVSLTQKQNRMKQKTF